MSESAASLPGARRWRRALYCYGPIVLVLAAAAALRFVDLGRFPLWWDEGNNAYFAHASFGDIVRVSRATLDTDPPVHRLALKGWLALWGYSPVALRSLSAFCGVLTVALTYVWGRWSRGSKAGLVAAAMLALWPMHIYYSREGKGYAWVALFACLSLYIWQRYVDGSPQWRFAPWLAASASGALALGAHYYALLFMVGEGIGLLALLTVERAPLDVSLRRLRYWISVQMVPIALVAPWAALTWASAFRGAERLPGGDGQAAILPYLRHVGSEVSTVLGAPTWAVVLAAVALAVLCVAALWRVGRRAPERLYAAAALVPLALGYCALQVIPFVRPRFFLFVLPPLALLAARGIARLGKWGPAAGLALALAWGASMPAAYHPYDQPTEDLTPLGDVLREHSRPGDAVIVTYIWQEGILRLLAPTAPVTYVLGWYDEESLSRNLEMLSGNHGRIWLLSYGVGSQDRANPAGWWLGQHAARALVASYPPNRLALYVPAPPFPVAEARPTVFANGVALEASVMPASAQAGDVLALSLRWRVNEPPASPATVFVHLVDGQGVLLCQSDGAPRNGVAPFEAATPGGIIDEARALLIPVSAAPGQYRVLVGLYDPVTGGRAQVVEGDAPGGDAATIGWVTITAAETRP